ncbi:heparinase II/III domain-containing protein [Neobacillus citreus]|uniref:Heparinase II/III family protein n=1 Tax=Neobacillus citreus TaxID=2833578 RepID=A0A942T7M8_9BACI|nr:heparinase II/III family protein [Neobacillus citreus]MCH6268985.1 heparinase II/III family protein [Neobacillus citreus]
MNHPNSWNVRNHPRILFSETELKQVRDSQISQEFFEQANQFLTETDFKVNYPSIQFQITVTLPLVQLAPLPEAPGYVDFPYWTMYSRAIEERITVLSTAYALTEDRKYGDKVKEYLLALAKFTRWYEFPNRGAEGNLSNAHFTLAAAIGYDSIYSLLNEQERNILQQAILANGLQPFEIDFENQDSHNIIASKRVAMLIGALSIADEQDVGQYLSNAYEYLFAYLEDRLTSPEIEGLLYTSVAIRHILMAADALNRATGDASLIGHDYFQTFLPELFLYMLGNAKKQSFVNFSDSFYTLDISYLMGMLAQRNLHPAASWYFQQAKTNHSHVLLHPKRMPDPIAPGEFFNQQHSKVIPSIGWAAFRNGWDKESHLLAFASSGSAKGHNHYDQNNFVLHVHDEWLMTNPGYQDYVPGPRNTFTTGTVGHNAMLINGGGQTELGRSRIADWYLSPSYDFCTGDATDAYNGAVKQWKRAILHIDQGYFLIVDRVGKINPEDRVSFLFHTTSSVIAAGRQLELNESIDSNHVIIAGGQAGASLYYCYPEQTKKTLEQFPGAEEYGTYIAVEPGGNLQEEFLVTLIVPHADKRLADKPLDYQVDRNYGTISIKVDREDYGVTDYLLFADSQESKQMTSEHTDFQVNGEQAWVCFNHSLQQPKKWVLINGTRLDFDGKGYLRSDKNLTARMERDRQERKYWLELMEETAIVIPCRESDVVLVNNQRYENSKTGILELVLPKGETVVQVIQQD